ncbi:MAG: MiaB/RimO family radical SAM methylthiotransferase [Caldisericia bacterium]|nr:MiaB/RimO family radical SAM methylthiotransferase [Caldisericia bacterium]
MIQNDLNITIPNRKQKKVSFVSLGCAKNTVITEKIAALFSQNGFQIVPESTQTDYFVINTCGFLATAREEGISVIQDILSTYSISPSQIIVLGCFAYRFPEILRSYFPSITLLQNQDPLVAVEDYFSMQSHSHHRILSTPSYAYIRIAQGCNRHCSYCLIPSIKGSYRSFSTSSILEECLFIADHYNVQELVLIAQDTSLYGHDLKEDINLYTIVRSIANLQRFSWIRILYMYPHQIAFSKLRDILSIPSVVPYIDMPFQHYHPDILARMNRPTNALSYLEEIYPLKDIFPFMTFRSTFIVGYPGETDSHFSFLIQKLKEYPLDRVGFFPYSQEKETPSYSQTGPVSEDIKQERMQKAYECQTHISWQLDSSHLSQIIPILLERFDAPSRCAIGRSIREAPDVDPTLHVYGNPFRLQHNVGSIVNCKLTKVTNDEIKAEIL